MNQRLPKWVDMIVIPILNLSFAFLVAGFVIAAIGENPIEALGVMANGAFGDERSLGYTLYYTTNFIFTGLAAAVAFKAKLFNIGGEGQAYVGGLGATLAGLVLGAMVPGIVTVPVAILAAAAFGAAWAFIPGYLQAYRGSHVVITTMMFNFIAAGIMVSLLSGPLMEPGQSSPQSDDLPTAAWLPQMHEIFAAVGLEIARSPLNLSFLIALLAAFGVWVLIWRTKFGYSLRAMGESEPAAVYAGVPVKRMTVIVLAISGALAGMMAINDILGVQHKLILNFTAGYGFTGIAAALIGRNHPVGILLASLLFGALYQGGTELDFEFNTISREMVLVIQGLIILFSGALAYMFNPVLTRLFAPPTAVRGAPAARTGPGV
jgi:simple sugar transport system permease protein